MAAQAATSPDRQRARRHPTKNVLSMRYSIKMGRVTAAFCSALVIKLQALCNRPNDGNK